MMKPLGSWMFLILVSVPPLFGQSPSPWFQTGQRAELMLSGVDFNNTGGALLFNHPSGLASDGTRLLLCDRFNNRILVWTTLPARWDAPPNLVLGQPDWTSNDPGQGKDRLNWAGNVSIGANGVVAAADTENDRILIWKQFPTRNAQPADISISLPALSLPGGGQLSWPWGVWTDGNRLAAVATQGSSILFWNSLPVADNQAPSYTIRLPQFGTPRNISTDGSSYFFVGDHNAHVTAGSDRPATFFWNSYPTRANQPFDFAREEWIKGTRLPDGKLVAGGLGNIYLWNSVPTHESHAPDLTMQPANYKNGDGPDIAFAGGRLYVNNYNGNNIQVFNSVPSQRSQEPDFAVGSPTPGYNTLQDLNYIQNPVVATDGTRLVVSSDFDAMLWIWKTLPARSGLPPDIRIPLRGLNLAPWDNALHDGRLVLAGKQSVAVWNALPLQGENPTRVFNRSIGSVTFTELRGVALDSQHLYLGDADGTITVWRGIPASQSVEPIRRIKLPAQPLNHLNSDGTYLCVTVQNAQPSAYIYRVAELAGSGENVQPFKTIASTSQLRLNLPAQALAFDGSFAISSTSNNGVLLWRDINDAGDPARMVVLGQATAAGTEAAIGASRLFMPATLAAYGNDLWVGELKFSSRILRFSKGAAAATTTTTTLPSGSTLATSTTTTTPGGTTTTTGTLPPGSSTTSGSTTTTTTLAPLYRLSVPLLRHDREWNTGIALVNPSAAPTLVRIRALDDSGQEVALADRQLRPDQQLSLMAEELFGPSTPATGWIMLESTVSGLAGFSLLMSQDLAAMDGIALVRSAVRDFVLPVWGDGEIHLANPAGTTVPYRLELVEGTGLVRGRVEGTLAPRAHRAIATRSLGAAAVHAYIRAITGGVAAAITTTQEGRMAAVAPREAAGNPVGALQYLSHYVSGAGYDTSVRLINLEREPFELQLRLVGDNGQRLGIPARIALPAWGSSTLEGAGAFGLAADATAVQGFLVIDGGGHAFDGGAVISGPRASTLTALSFQSAAVSETILAHAVRNEAFWTGLALLNPGPQQSTVKVRWFRPTGELQASASLELPAQGRWVGLLDQLMTGLSGSASGYLRIQSSQGMIPYALFGTHDGEALSAIPPER